MKDWIERTLQKGGWATVGAAALVGFVLGLVSWLETSHGEGRTAPWYLGGSAVLGAVSGGILLLLERINARQAGGRKDR
jgi:hypothetical protein